MNIQEISNIAPKIKCYDPLASFLGSFDGGIVEYDFEYIAKLTGHACPTVLTSYLSANAVAKALFVDEPPMRGNVKMYFSEQKDSGTTGVMASVFQTIFGSSDEGGFKGIGNLFERANRCEFGANMDSFAKFCRLDNDEFVTLDFDFTPVQKIATPDIFEALSRFKKNEDISEFQKGWLAKLAFIAKNFDKLSIAKIKSSSKI